MTCKQPFTGTMMGLAEAWWSRVKHMPEGKELRLTAGNHLANELDNQGRMVEAEAMYRDVLRVLRRRCVDHLVVNIANESVSLASLLQPLDH